MKVLISTDIEGVSGVVATDETVVGGQDYEKARRWMTGDTNAAVEGAIAGGATEVVVVDVHGLLRNIIYDELHPRARLIRGGSAAHRPLLVLEGLDRSFNLVLLVGFHASVGLDPGVLNHTYLLPSEFFETRINGEVVSEAQIAGALAGYFDVPVGLITGDDVACAEMKTWAPWVETAVVKYAIDRQAACCLPIGEAQTLIREGAERAVRRISECRSFAFSKPTKLEVVTAFTTHAAKLATIPGTVREDDRVVSFTSEDYLRLYKTYINMCLQCRPERRT